MFEFFDGQEITPRDSRRWHWIHALLNLFRDACSICHKRVAPGAATTGGRIDGGSRLFSHSVHSRRKEGTPRENLN